MNHDKLCIFCNPDESRIIASDPLAYAIRDVFPVSRGHALIIPRRHVADFFEATPEEIAALFRLLGVCKNDLDRQNTPDGYNVGVNIGRAAGQTVFHLHIHLIPRYEGDCKEPTGGVRNVIPGCGPYR